MNTVYYRPITSEYLHKEQRLESISMLEKEMSMAMVSTIASLTKRKEKKIYGWSIYVTWPQTRLVETKQMFYMTILLSCSPLK